MATAANGMAIRATGIRHATVRTSDLARARVFYVVRLGFSLLDDADDRFVFRAGASTITVLGPSAAAAGDEAGIGRPGLECIALECGTPEELRRVADALSAAGIQHSGLRVEPASGCPYLALRDPDGIAWTLCAI